MLVRKAIFFLVCIYGLVSCVTNNKVQYLQYEDVNPDTVLLDKVVRTYNNNIPQYKLQSGDVIDIQIESLTESEYDFFSNSLTADNFNNISPGSAAIQGELLDSNGEIRFPVVGSIKLENLTILEAQSIVQEIARRFLSDPVVKIRLLNYRFTVLGEVKQERTITSFNSPITMLEAIGLAGGLTDLGDKSKVKLIRQKNGVTEVQYLNLLDEDFINSPYYYVHQSDVIVVPPLKQRPYRNYFGQNLAIVLSSVSTILLVINLFVN